MFSLLFWIGIGCQSEEPKPMVQQLPTPEKPKAMDIANDELKKHLPWLSAQDKPNPATRRLQIKAFQYILSAPESSRPALFAMYEQDRSAQKNIVVVLGRMLMEEDVDFFATTLTSPVPGVSFASAQALAESISDKARLVLEKSVSSHIGYAKKNAIIGLGLRQDTKSCSILKPLKNETDDGLRYQIIRSMLRIGCLDQAEKNSMLSSEKSEKIKKELAK